MSNNLRGFLQGLTGGLNMYHNVADRQDQRDYRRQQLLIAQAKNKLDAQRHAERMILEERRVAATEKDVEGRYAKNMRPPGAGKLAKPASTPEQEAYTRKWGGGFNPAGDQQQQQAPPSSVNIEAQDPPLDNRPIDWGDGPIGAARGGRIPQMARGGSVPGMLTSAINTGMNVAYARDRMRRRDQWGSPINPNADPSRAAGTSGPGSGYGAIATRPPTQLHVPVLQTEEDFSGTGGFYQNGGKVRRYQDGGEVLPPYDSPYWTQGGYPWQGPDPASGRPPDEYYLPERRYPTDRPPQNLDQSPDRSYRPDPGYEGRVAVEGFRRTGPVAEDVPVQQGEFPYVYPPNSYTGSLDPPGSARPGRPTSYGKPRATPRRGADPSSGPGTWDPPGTGAPATVADVGLAEEPPPFKPEELTRRPPVVSVTRGPLSPEDKAKIEGWANPPNDSPDQYYRDDPRTRDPRTRPGFDSPDQYYRDDPRTRAAPQTMPPVTVSGSRGDGTVVGGSANGVARGGGGGGGRGRGAIDARWKPLRDPTREAAFDPVKDRYDPENVHAVDHTGAALAGATSYAQRVFGQAPANAPGQVQGQQRDESGARGQARAERGKAALYSGVGAADPNLLNQIFQKVDPENKMSMDQKMVAAVTQVHKFYADQGDMENANKSAFEVAQAANQIAKQHGAEAIKLYQAGNKQGALDMLIKGYNLLPDGNNASVQNGQLVITSEAGQPVAAYVLDDRAMQNIALGMASGQLGVDVIRMAGKTMAGTEGGPPGGPPGGGVAPPAPTGAAQPAAAPAGPSAQPPAATAPAGSAAPARPPSAAPQGPRTHDGLPARRNPDGSHSTELSITVTNPRLNGGKPTNIPSLWGGREVSEDEAVDNALKSGKPYPSFNSIPEAVSAAEQKSAAGGANAPVRSPPPAGPSGQTAARPAGPAAPPAGPPVAGTPPPPAPPPTGVPGSPAARTTAPPAAPAAPAAGGTKPAIETKPPFKSAEAKAGADPKLPAQSDNVETKEETLEKKIENHFKADPYKPLPIKIRTVTEDEKDNEHVNRINREIAAEQARINEEIKQNRIEGQQARMPVGVVNGNIARQQQQFETWRRGKERQLEIERVNQQKQDMIEQAARAERPHTEAELEAAKGKFAERRDKLQTDASAAPRGDVKGSREVEAAEKRKRDYNRSVLRYLKDPEDQAVLERAAVSIWMHNKKLTATEAFDAAVAATRIMPTGKSEANLQTGAGATEYTPFQNHRRGVVLQFPRGGAKVHIDEDGYAAIQQLHRANWAEWQKSKGAEADRQKKVDKGFSGAIELLPSLTRSGVPSGR